MQTAEYIAAPTMVDFHNSDDFVRGLLGPIGSGKSVACCVEVVKRACEQEPYFPESQQGVSVGVRKSRWAIIRNTYRELIDTTMQTWFDWFPRELGEYRAMDMKWTMVKLLPDGTKLHLEVLFRALDRPDDIKKLLSLELTGGWLNEAREIPKQVLDMLQGRVGRYPSKREGGASWFGIICDTNPPDSDHWWYKLFEEDRPEGFSLYHQPSGVGPDAENIDNLPPNYYQNMMQGKDQEWINVYVHGLYGFIADGKPVYPEYKDDIHHVDYDLPLSGSGTIYVGLDFGLTPAALIGQETASGQFQIIDELVTEDMGAKQFGKLLHKKLSREYCGCTLEIYGDPAGEDRAQTDEDTVFSILQEEQIDAWPAYTNDYTIRREVVADYLTRLDMRGKPAFIIGPKAVMFRKGMAGGYKYKRLQVTGEQRFQDKPLKNKYSHVCEAGQYLMLGAVGGDRVMGGFGKQELDYSNIQKRIA